MKTLNEIIRELQSLQEQGFGEAPVYVFADHGQTFIQADSPTLEKAEELGYTIEDLTDEEGVPFICIGD